MISRVPRAAGHAVRLNPRLAALTLGFSGASMERTWIGISVALLASTFPFVMGAGCARGGGGDLPDSGVRLMDSGTTPGVDGSLPSVDSGPGGFDAGPTDSGGGGGCTETPCRLVSPQCGCAVGQGCYISGGDRVCGAPGTELTGQACAGATACQAGNLCVGDASMSAALCRRFCDSDSDCAGAGALCLLTLSDGMGGSIPDATLCTAACNPASSTGCPPTMGCDIFQESMGAMRVLTDCRAAGSTGEGATCTDSDQCAPGLFCGGATGSQMCVRYCQLPGGTCGAGTTCNAFTDPVIVGGIQYGYCL